MNSILVFISAVVGIIIGNWLGKLLIFPQLMKFFTYKIDNEVNKRKSRLVSMYLHRVSMGLMVGILFALISYFGSLSEFNNSMLTWIYGIEVLFFSEPSLGSNSAQLFYHEVLKGDDKKYNKHKNYLKLARFLSYFIMKLIVFTILLVVLG